MAAIAALGDAKRRVVDEVKTSSPCTTRQVAEALGISEVAARQHLSELERHGLLVARTAPPAGPGRPRVLWSLTPLAQGLFADRHDDLIVDLLEAIHETLGEDGLSAVLEHRAGQQLTRLRDALAPEDPLLVRLERLAAERVADGYMAEVRQVGDELQLVEHHCPVRAAADCCPQLCVSELEIFREALGPDVVVERTDHVLGGDERCVYRVSNERSPSS